MSSAVCKDVCEVPGHVDSVGAHGRPAQVFERGPATTLHPAILR